MILTFFNTSNEWCLLQNVKFSATIIKEIRLPCRNKNNKGNEKRKESKSWVWQHLRQDS